MKNIVLIGMPAAGKSTIGVILAKALGYDFIDADLVIQSREGALLKDIIKEKGLDEFIRIENEVNQSIMNKHAVIATGGSVVYGREAMKHYYETATVVYIQLNYDTLVKRLGNIKQRGVVLREGQTLEELYRERCPLYEKYAHIIVDAEALDVEGLMEKIYLEIKKGFTN
ncbi:MAG: shikimate kinase [Lachnospiraceae bacterium]|nr:shikimate kinase [Lachnospiraceae bacterium]